MSSQSCLYRSELTRSVDPQNFQERIANLAVEPFPVGVSLEVAFFYIQSPEGATRKPEPRKPAARELAARNPAPRKLPPPKPVTGKPNSGWHVLDADLAWKWEKLYHYFFHYTLYPAYNIPYHDFIDVFFEIHHAPRLTSPWRVDGKKDNKRQNTEQLKLMCTDFMQELVETADENKNALEKGDEGKDKVVGTISIFYCRAGDWKGEWDSGLR